MIVSTKGRYGLRAMVDMAINSPEEYTPLNIIAERQNISVNYLEQVFALLKKAQLVKSIRGNQGGYALSKTPSEMSVGDILRVLEGELIITSDDDKSSFNTIEKCINSVVWETVNTKINDIVNSITLEQLVSEYKRIDDTYTLDYII